MRSRTQKRSDLLTDAFARELHKRMFNQTWRWAGRYRKTEKNLGWEVARLDLVLDHFGRHGNFFVRDEDNPVELLFPGPGFELVGHRPMPPSIRKASRLS